MGVLQAVFPLRYRIFIRDRRTWAIAFRGGSYKSLFLLNSGRFPLENKGNSVPNFGSLARLKPSKSLWPKFFPLQFYKPQKRQLCLSRVPLRDPIWTGVPECTAVAAIQLRMRMRILPLGSFETIFRIWSKIAFLAYFWLLVYFRLLYLVLKLFLLEKAKIK